MEKELGEKAEVEKMLGEVEDVYLVEENMISTT